MAKRLNPADTLVQNLKALLEAVGMKKAELARQSGVSLRQINYILSRERTPSVEVADDLARPFKLLGWHLLMPGLQADLAKSGKLKKLMDNYAHSSNEGRSYIDRVAEREARYAPKHNDKSA